MDANQAVAIYTTTNMIEAQVLKNALEDEGIPCQIDSENSGGLVGLVEIKLLIHASDVERAQELVVEHEEHQSADVEEEVEEEKI